VKLLKTLAVSSLLLMLTVFCFFQTSAGAQGASPETISPAGSPEEKPQVILEEDEEIPPVGPNAIFPAVVARVDGKPILGRDLEVIVHRELAPIGNPEWKNLREDYRGQLTLAALNILINTRLIYQEALAGGMQATDEEVQAELKKIRDSYDSDADMNAALAEQMMDRAMLESDLYQRVAVNKYLQEKIVKNIIVTPEEVNKYYVENPDQFHHPELVRTSHILILSGETSAQDSLAKQRAESLLQRVNKGEDFAKLAKEYSMDASASRGGDIGFNRKEDLSPEFGETAFSLPVGGTKIIKSEYGYHIIKVTDKKEAGLSTLEEIRDQLSAFLENQKVQVEQTKLINQLREKADIELLIPAGQPLKP
jgi:peptidyl-prolyl cis-trans isomerase C